MGASLLSLVDPSFAYDPSAASSSAAVSPATGASKSDADISAAAGGAGMSRSMSDQHMDEQRGRHASSHSRRSSGGVGGGQHDEMEDVLKPDDPSLDTCCIVRTRMDAAEQEVDRRILAMLDQCLSAAHQQYHLTWPTHTSQRHQHSTTTPTKMSTSQQQPPSPSPSPSLRSVPSTPPCNGVLVYQPHLATYAPAAFREFRALLATFRRVQSQLSPSLAVSATNTPDHCLLPARGDSKGKAVNGVGRAAVEGRRSMGADAAAGDGAGCRRDGGSGMEGVHEETGYEGVVIVPQLYYAVPQP